MEKLIEVLVFWFIDVLKIIKHFGVEGAFEEDVLDVLLDLGSELACWHWIFN